MKKESGRDNKGLPNELAALDKQLKVLMEEFGFEQAVIDSFLIEHPGLSELAVKKELLQSLQFKKEGKESTGE